MGFTVADVERAQEFAREQAGKPYAWGGVGPTGYDCSGFQSVLLNVLEDRADIHVRRFGTGTIGDGVVVGPDARSDTDSLFRHFCHAPADALRVAAHPEDDDMQPFSFRIANSHPVRFAYVLPDGTVVDDLENDAAGLGAFRSVYENKNADARQVDIVQQLVRRARGIS